MCRQRCGSHERSVHVRDGFKSEGRGGLCAPSAQYSGKVKQKNNNTRAETGGGEIQKKKPITVLLQFLEADFQGRVKDKGGRCALAQTVTCSAFRPALQKSCCGLASLPLEGLEEKQRQEKKKNMDSDIHSPFVSHGAAACAMVRRPGGEAARRRSIDKSHPPSPFWPADGPQEER